jgi:hypothetical protein
MTDSQDDIPIAQERQEWDAESLSMPTHLALVARRLNMLGLGQGADSFLNISYAAEAVIKTIGVVLVSSLREGFPDDAYRLSYALVHADGLGVWDTAIRECARNLSAQLPHEVTRLREWVTRKRPSSEDVWLADSMDACNEIFSLLAIQDRFSERQRAALDLITALIRIRGKTKAHGAVTQDFYAQANPLYGQAVYSLVRKCPVADWDWASFQRRGRNETVMIALTGQMPAIPASPPVSVPNLGDRPHTVCFRSPESEVWIACDDLLISDKECQHFSFPNGQFTNAGRSEFIDYASGHCATLDSSHYTTPPAPLPVSETHGSSTLEVRSNAFENLPTLPGRYVRRPNLERELEDRLRDKNHTIITLHGRGGVGKTWLALQLAGELSQCEPVPFDSIVWFSARDLDLHSSGPKRVKQDVVDLKAITRLWAKLFEKPASIEAFAEALQLPDALSGRGTLFVLDNFETLANTTEIHKFLDTHTRIPNKVLLTSRERAFKADFYITIEGMERREADELMTEAGRDLGVEGLLTETVKRSFFEYSDGHAYALRVLVGELAKEGRFVVPPQLIRRRDDVLDAVFQRSFNQLSDDGRRVFLSVARWRSAVSEIALLVVLGPRGIDVEAGLEECARASLLVETARIGDHRCFEAPQLARVFGKKKLTGDPDRLVIEEDLDLLRGFGDMELDNRQGRTFEDQVGRFIRWAHSPEAVTDDSSRVENMLEVLASLWPDAWLALSEYRYERRYPREDVEYAARRAVEEMPFNKEAWLTKARFAREYRDDSAEVAALISAVDADPFDLELLSRTARVLARYISTHKTEIPQARRHVYLANVRDAMEHVSRRLDADGLSQLGWLFFLEGDIERARDYAESGCRSDPMNENCRKLLSRLSTDR